MPCIGALVAIGLLGEPLSATHGLAGALMALSVWLHLSERHEHEHTHAHRHDFHHQHMHDFVWDGHEPYVHHHVHAALIHKHPHYPDIHHRHFH